MELVNQLAENGITSIIDQIDLQPGDEANAFMERMVNDESISKVLIISDRKYAEKSNKRTGGAGTESQIISPEIYKSKENSRFVCIVTEFDDEGKPYIPTYYTSRIYINLSDQERYSAELERLIRWIYGKPSYQRPVIGNAPTYINEELSSIVIHTTSRQKSFLSANKSGRSGKENFLGDYLETLASGLSELEMNAPDMGAGRQEAERMVLDQFNEKIQDFMPYRNEFVEVCRAISGSPFSDEYASHMHSFFEEAMKSTYPSSETRSWNEIQFDAKRFVAYEMFIYFVAAIVKKEKFQYIQPVIKRDFYVPHVQQRSAETLCSFSHFQQEMPSIEIWNRLGKTQWNYPIAQLFMERIEGSKFDVREIAEADMVLYLLSRSHKTSYSFWPPFNCVNWRSRSPLPIFARCRSKLYFDKLFGSIGLTKSDLEDLSDEVRASGGLLRRGHFTMWTLDSALDVSSLASAP
ncbi:TIR domain-containing protein [Teichococcus deserti]|uniref:TIR domain-containing protein n=1 Tax=Teichococcus deserti TaxID=1817963 RepID=UPI001F6182E3|nr:TIR domain-containing protein [Pseudoroseomonas deserti]